MAEFALHDYLADQGRLILNTSEWDMDSFPALGERFLHWLSASLIDKQLDTDLHTWLIDFEGCQLLLKAEHYSASIWLETLSDEQGREELAFIAQLLSGHPSAAD